MHPRIGIEQVNCAVGHSRVNSGLILQKNQSEGTVQLWVQLVCEVCVKGGIPGVICSVDARHSMSANFDDTGGILLRNAYSEYNPEEKSLESLLHKSNSLLHSARAVFRTYLSIHSNREQ